MSDRSDTFVFLFKPFVGTRRRGASSSGKTTRHRLNRSGDRQANNALWVIAMVRLRSDPATRAYSQRRKEEGLSHREIVRCIKRYLARRLYPILIADLAKLT